MFIQVWIVVIYIRRITFEFNIYPSIYHIIAVFAYYMIYRAVSKITIGTKSPRKLDQKMQIVGGRPVCAENLSIAH